MVTLQDGALVILGLIALFSGYSLFRGMLPLWGFVVMGWLAFTLFATVAGPQLAGNLVIKIVAVVIAGLIGAAIAVPLYYVIIFLSGGALGMLLGIMVGAVIDVGGPTTVHAIRTLAAMSFPPSPQSTTQFLLMIVFGLVLGGLSIGFQKFMICASSAYIGAAGVIYGLSGPIAQMAATDASRGAIMMVGWLLLGMIGLVIQFRMMGEV